MRALLPVALLAVVLTAAACAPTQRVPLDAAPDAGAYRQVLVPRPLVPLEGEGAVLMRFADERESGTVRLQARPGPTVRLELRARITGTLALDLRFDPERLLVLDYANERYFSGRNTAAVRYRLFSLDFTPDEFLILLTGRVPRALFDTGRGRRPDRDTLVFTTGAATHRITLDGEGLPAEWRKSVDGYRVYRVEFRSYQELPFFAGQAPLRLPRQARVYLENDGESVMVLGLSDLRHARPPAIRVTAQPEPGWRPISLSELPPPPDAGS